MSGQLFGWNLLYNSVSKDIKNNGDVLLCLTHLVLVSDGFQCIGLGDSRNVDGTEEKTETLPNGWNEINQLRYLYKGKLYNLQATRLDDGVMFNLVRVDEQNVSMVNFNNVTVASRTGTLDEMIPTNQNIIKLIREELINRVTTSVKSKDCSSQTASENRNRPTSPGFQQVPPMRDHGIDRYSVPRIGVGYNDLNPLAGIGGPYLGGVPHFSGGPLGGGGGMLFQPNLPDDRRTGLPQGALPPGARFDPFRPPDVDRFQGGRGRARGNVPDNDDYPPPGFDDMFM